MLLTSQRNEIFAAIQQAGLDPASFKENFTEKPTGYFIVPVGGKGVWFRVQQIGSSYKIDGRPGFDGRLNFQYERPYWSDVFSYLADWLQAVKNELNIPDLWADLQANARLFAPTSEAPEEVFTPDEARQLRIQLQHIQQQLLTAGLPEAAARQLAQTVREAGEKAERFTKKEWQGWFIGSMISAMTSLAMSPDSVKVVYQILKTTFTGLFLP